MERTVSRPLAALAVLGFLGAGCNGEAPYTEADCIEDSIEFDGMTIDEARDSCRPPEDVDDGQDGYYAPR